MSGKATRTALPVRLGIAGCGRIVERGYLPALREADGIVAAALADPDQGRARQLAGLCGAAIYDSASAMIAAGGLDGVIVTTPAERHLEVAERAAAAGLPALVEKPPATGLEDALALAALDPAPAFAFNRRFLQGAELRPLVPPSGWLELELELRFRRDGWGAHVSRDEALLDAGTHLVDLAIFLAGSEPIAVRGAVVEPEGARFELELGRGRAQIRCATDRPYAERIEVRDRAGGSLGGTRTDRMRARARRVRGGGDPLVGSLRDQAERFAARLRGERAEELAGPEAAVATMAVVEAARRSAALDGAEVTVAPRADGPKTEAGIALSARRPEDPA